MNWSVPIARLFGVELRVHGSFLLVLIFGAFQFGGLDDVQGMLFGVLLTLLLFGCVVLHELGHSVVAMHFGIPVRQILLLPVGGVALLSRTPDKPRQELWIASAGPLVNLVLALVLLLVTSSATRFDLLDSSGLLQGDVRTPSLAILLYWMIWANFSLAFFNLIPAFPLDGGRMLRAILATFLGPLRATRIASGVGQLLAFGLGAVGIATGDLTLLVVAGFVFLGTSQEVTELQARAVLRSLRVGDAYNRHALTLTIGDRLSKVIDYILTSYQPDFAVLQGSKLLGIITRDEVLGALSSYTRDPYVTEIMRREVVRVEAKASLHEVRQQLLDQDTRVGAVYTDSTYLGLVSLDDIAEAFAVLTFVQRQDEARRAAHSAGTRQEV